MIGTESRHRTVLTEAVVPPDGYELDAGVVCTYSLSLPTLLTLPAHVVLGDDRSCSELLDNPVALLDALRRARDKLTVFVHAGGVHVPRGHHLLYSLLEPVIHEVSPKSRPDLHAGGSFHPKLWALRFTPRSGDGPLRLRLLVLSRNLTEDRSWDLSLTLDGLVSGGRKADNGDLRRLLRSLAGGLPSVERREQVESVAESVSRAVWDVPPPFDSLRFVVLGISGATWLPWWEGSRSDSLVVVSPFVEDSSLAALAATTRSAVALVSRSEALARLAVGAPGPFCDRRVLREHAASEDGEELDPALRHQQGLHAKAYLYQRGRRVRVAMGSANATPRALLAAGNVEVMAILEGPAAACGLPADLLDEAKGIGELLEPWVPVDSSGDEEAEAVARRALEALEAVRERLVEAGLEVECEPVGEGWTLLLTGDGPVDLDGAASVVAWPVTCPASHAVEAGLLGEDLPVPIPVETTALVTGLIAFELTHPDAPHAVRFVLNLPIFGVPDDRHAHVVQAVLHGSDGFLRYLRYLLGELDSDEVAPGGGGAASPGWGRLMGFEDGALLESLTRALSRDPARLAPVRELVEHLRSSEEGRSILPEEFSRVWAAFLPLLPERSSGEDRAR